MSVATGLLYALSHPLSWRQAFLVKTLWNIHHKKDTLWVKWVNEFFLRGCSWEWVPKKDSASIFKNLVRIRDEMVLKKGTVQATVSLLETWSHLCYHNPKWIEVDEERSARYVLVKSSTSNCIPEHGVPYVDVKE